MKLLFATQSYQYLVEEVYKILPYHKEAIIKGEMERTTFPDGEVYHHILNDVNGADVILIGGTIDDLETLEIFDIGCSVVKNGVRSLTVIIPYFGYSTMERAVKSGEIVKAKTRAMLLSSIPSGSVRNRVLLIDLHSEGIPHYFEGNIQTVHLYAKDIITQACGDLCGDDFVLASTDAGRAKWVESLAKEMNVECAIITKRRLSGSETQISNINANVKNKNVIIYDDMIRTGGSLLKAAKTYKDSGANKIFAIATHGVFPDNSLQNLYDSHLFEKIVVTNTHPKAQQLRRNFLQVQSVANLIATNI